MLRFLREVSNSDWLAKLTSTRVFFAVVVATAAIHCITLARSPTVWQDEVQIVDYGRVLANPSTDWSLTLDRDGRPAILLTPCYGWLQHQWLSLVGVGPFQVRFLSLISAIGLVFVFLGMLRSIGVSDRQSILVSLALWFDPMLVRSFAGGRADAFTLMLSVIAAWSWHVALKSGRRSLAILAGAAAATAMLSWPTAAVTLVLGVYFYVDAVLCARRGYLSCALAASIGFALILGGYLLVFSSLLERALASLSVPTKAADRAEAVMDVIPAILGSYARSPWVLLGLVAAVGASWRQPRHLLLVATILASFGVACTVGHMYGWRVMYVVPAIYVIIARVLDAPRLHGWIAILLLVPSFLVNMVVRSGVTVVEWERRDYAAYESALAETIPPDVTVVGGWSHYYAGRHLNWRMFTTFPPSLANEHCFYVIRRQSKRPLEFPGFCFEYLGRIEIGGPPLLRGLAASYEAEVYRARAVFPERQ